jgi:peptidoglycan hydrolase-like protein with peptidoglycan-binding domain
MSKRNFILLIIILTIALIVIFAFLFSGQNTATPGGDTGGTNFISQFNPFDTNPTKPPVVTPPVDISENPPVSTIPEIKPKLIKVSSMPVAGFAVYQKERLIEVPVVAPVSEETAAQNLPYRFGDKTLKNGSSGEEVKEIQRFLNNTLSLSLELNGLFNTEVNTAVKQWQSSHGLIADGTVGAKTKTAMYSSVNQKIGTTKPTPPPTEFVPALRYVDRASGNIYQTFADKIEERKFSTTIIPKIYEAFFGNNGESVVMRYLKGDGRTIATFVGNLPKEILGGDTTSENEVKGSFLPENIKDVSVSGDASNIFYLFENTDNMIGTTLNLFTNKKVQIFDSAFTEWLSNYPNNKMITLTTKAASGFPGYMYKTDPVSKNLTKVLGDINGLTTLTSPDGKLVLYGNDSLALSVYHMDTKTSDTLGVNTLPEKCVWGKMSDAVYCAVPKNVDGNQYPDAWYQGEVSFSDQLWKIDLTNGNGTLIADPINATGGEDVDGIKLTLDEGENYLLFVNKKDSFLWELGLK